MTKYRWLFAATVVLLNQLTMAQAVSAQAVRVGVSYSFRNYKSGLYLASNNGASHQGAEVLQKGNPGTGGLWVFEKVGGYYQIRSLYSGLYIANFGARNNGAVLKETGNPGRGALWRIVRRADGYYQFQNRLSGLYLANGQRMRESPIFQLHNPGPGSLWARVRR